MIDNDMGYSNLKTVKYIGDYKVECFFDDGEAGILDLKPYTLLI